MAEKIGFLILTHKKLHQVIRLFNRLNGTFDYPPLVYHHNFPISNFPKKNLTKNIKFVKPFVKTKWEKFSTIKAELKALELMYTMPSSPDWFVVLSSADYPIKSAETIINDLTSNSCDVYMHHGKVKYQKYDSYWQELGYDRYCIVRGWVPSPDKKFRPKNNFIHSIKDPAFTKFFVPFSEEFHCFVGDHFFCANRKVANYLLGFHKAKPCTRFLLSKGYNFST